MSAAADRKAPKLRFAAKAAFWFFLVKGLLWLAVPAAVAVAAWWTR